MYPCLLEAAGQPAGRPFTVLGLSTQSYQIERPLALTTVPDALAEYGKIALVGASQAIGRAVCVETTWRLPAETREDWRVAGRLLTVPRVVVARARTDANPSVTDVSWEAGETAQACSLLRLPVGAPQAGSARLRGVRPHGLDRLINSALARA